MRRLALATLLLALAALPAVAEAHPLGNFSVNHLAVVSVSNDRVDVRYVLDQAEIPTFRERGVPEAELVARKRAAVARGLTLTVDGDRVPLVMDPGGGLTLRAGQAGLSTLRLTLRGHAAVDARRTVVLRDRTFPGRVGWSAIVAAPGHGTAVRSSVAATDPTRGLTVYPAGLLDSPADVREATLRVSPGSGTLEAPGRQRAATGDRSGGAGGFAGLLDEAAAGRGVLLLLLAAAFGWGAIHALSPGHGKTMVAAYLIGTNGRARDALALGLTVTVTHTIGVFALAFVTLALSAYVLPEDLYPWLNLVSGLLVVTVGLAVLRSRARSANAHDQGHDHHHPHTPGGTLALGASAGMIPCPSALVVLLGAISQHEVALGLLLIVAFSAGLAATLTLLGVLVVKATRLPAPGRLATILPAVSAVVIVGVGLLLTFRALPEVLG
jgi:nickel/cobalt exporter